MVTSAQSPSDPPDSERPAPPKGRSLWSHAWKRLRKNRLALISAGFIILVAVAGASAPLIAEHITHFDPEEQHTQSKHKPPGTRDTSHSFATFDGEKGAFDIVDFDGDGYLTCRAVEGTHELSCPELKLADAIAYDHFDYFFALPGIDRVTGNAIPDGHNLQPDRFITWHEFPHTDADLVDPRFRGLGLTGLDAFHAMDIDGDYAIARWEVDERARLFRYATVPPKGEGHRSVVPFVKRFDKDGDLRISRAEYPGAPVLRVFAFGTDSLGRDVLTRVIYGGWLSIKVALWATMIALLIGVIYGAISGYYGGRVDNIMMRIVDVLYGIPFMFLVILLIVMAGREMEVLFISLGAVMWLNMARVVRGQVISLKTREFVEAARALGASRMAIVFRHLIRNAIGPVVVYSTLLVPAVILQEAFLSFLGLGLDLSWGILIADGVKEIETFPWLIVFPGAALALTLFAMNFLGDGVRDAIDVKQS